MVMDIIKSMETVTEQVRLGTLPRRKIRNLLFRIIQNKVWEEWQKPLAPGLAQIIESQFRPVEFGGEELLMTWKNFATLWDVHPNEPLLVITQREWFHAGGKVDSNTNVLSPTGFTNQKFD